MSVQRVAIVRPRWGIKEFRARIIQGVAFTALFGWLLMLIAGAVTTWDPSYWHSILTYLGARFLQRGSEHRDWSFIQQKGEKVL